MGREKCCPLGSLTTLAVGFGSKRRSRWDSRPPVLRGTAVAVAAAARGRHFCVAGRDTLVREECSDGVRWLTKGSLGGGPDGVELAGKA